MRGEEAVTAVTMPEAGRDGEQPLSPAGLGCGARGETGGRGPQESRKQYQETEVYTRGKEVTCLPSLSAGEILQTLKPPSLGLSVHKL
ncbi:uncharacterized protein C11orf97 homolog [Orcinus orca]|uniref:uncharacterized protein C11orf97 homolog n=1 Tax=Orcinus orca TaxID=9733 RepID=UPI0021111AD6|nr:uncharacterized protein C11orf97 homolog [Orcinus orca]